ncbi:hypothetical protein CRUP_035365 [Coryphaenoides rupestris]|nr:hypothetical protein CRUP_035365 [Coryphaenoides rupestris]
MKKYTAIYARGNRLKKGGAVEVHEEQGAAEGGGGNMAVAMEIDRTLQTVGPSHARTYTVAVYFKGERIGCGKGPSIQQAEMN